jgi:hypothetical protein
VITRWRGFGELLVERMPLSCDRFEHIFAISMLRQA